MAGGSAKRESPMDRQCGEENKDGCGRYFNYRGIREHEESCSHPAWADPLVEYEDDVDDVQDETDDAVDVEEPTAPIGADPAEEAVTDGGNPAFGAPEATPKTSTSEPATPDDVEDETEDAAEYTTCPACGDEFDESDDELRARFGAGATRLRHACGKVLRVVL